MTPSWASSRRWFLRSGRARKLDYWCSWFLSRCCFFGDIISFKWLFCHSVTMRRLILQPSSPLSEPVVNTKLHRLLQNIRSKHAAHLHFSMQWNRNNRVKLNPNLAIYIYEVVLCLLPLRASPLVTFILAMPKSWFGQLLKRQNANFFTMVL